MTRMSIDEYFMRIAHLVAERGTCRRRKVGCVLADAKGRVLATGYNGTPPGFPHCTDHPCPGVNYVSGEGLNACWAQHAEANAVVFCLDLLRVHTCYSTASPCESCVKLLLNTPCRRIVYAHDYPGMAREWWLRAEREWVKYDGRTGAEVAAAE